MLIKLRPLLLCVGMCFAYTDVHLVEDGDKKTMPPSSKQRSKISVKVKACNEMAPLPLVVFNGGSYIILNGEENDRKRKKLPARRRRPIYG